MKTLRKILCIPFIFFLMWELYKLLVEIGRFITKDRYDKIIVTLAITISLILLISSIRSICKKCKTFNGSDHKIIKN